MKNRVFLIELALRASLLSDCDLHTHTHNESVSSLSLSQATLSLLVGQTVSNHLFWWEISRTQPRLLRWPLLGLHVGRDWSLVITMGFSLFTWPQEGATETQNSLTKLWLGYYNCLLRLTFAITTCATSMLGAIVDGFISYSKHKCETVNDTYQLRGDIVRNIPNSITLLILCY